MNTSNDVARLLNKFSPQAIARRLEIESQFRPLLVELLSSAADELKRLTRGGSDYSNEAALFESCCQQISTASIDSLGSVFLLLYRVKPGIGEIFAVDVQVRRNELKERCRLLAIEYIEVSISELKRLALDVVASGREKLEYLQEAALLEVVSTELRTTDLTGGVMGELERVFKITAEDEVRKAAEKN